MSKDLRSDPRFPRKDKKTPSIWDDDVDIDKLAKLTKKEKGKFFPNDYDANGNPRGDF
jgi:hypothetical protein